MKRFLIVTIIILNSSLFAQSSELDEFDMSIIDSCIMKLDSSCKVIDIQFINGKNFEFEKAFIDQLESLNFIDYVLYNYKFAIIDMLKGISIKVNYESTSCWIQSGHFSTDSATLQISQLISNNDFSSCWRFKNDKGVEPCN